MYRGGIFHGDRVALFGALDHLPAPAVTDPARVLLVSGSVTVEEWRRRAAYVEAASSGRRDSWLLASRHLRVDADMLVSAAAVAQHAATSASPTVFSPAGVVPPATCPAAADAAVELAA